MDSSDRLLLTKSNELVEKLVNEVTRLRRDVQRLTIRITEYEGEPPVADPIYKRLRPQTFREVVDEIQRARSEIRAAEQEIGRIGAAIDQMRNDSWSRAEMKPWLKE